MEEKGDWGSVEALEEGRAVCLRITDAEEVDKGLEVVP